jgi:hypothetical protein
MQAAYRVLFGLISVALAIVAFCYVVISGDADTGATFIVAALLCIVISNQNIDSRS